jgi:ribonuclease kappa
MVKPVVSAMNAWTCVVLSVFAIIILSTIGALFKSGSHTMLGGEEDPEDGNAVAGAVFGAVFIYIVCSACTQRFCADAYGSQGFLVFCGFQGFLHIRESRRGAISLS